MSTTSLTKRNSDFLLEQLVGIVIHDQRPPPPPFPDAETQREAVYKAAKEIVAQAKTVEKGLRDLETALSAFNVAIGGSDWSAAMLEEVFVIEYVRANAIDPPELFDPLRGFNILHAEALKEIGAELRLLSTLPVRSGRRSNKVRNHVLRQALITCRTFWEEQLGRSWSRYMLPDWSPKGSGRRGKLVGKCESFVSDMLTEAGIEFDLKNLNGAWSAFDKETARQSVAKRTGEGA